MQPTARWRTLGGWADGKTQKEDGTWDRRQTRRCVRRGDGGTLRLPKQDVHDALTRYEFAAAAEGEDYVLSYRERRT